MTPPSDHPDHAQPAVYAIPRAAQRDEPWANGAGSTTVVLREPDSADWRIRISVATVDREGPFSELAGTRRVLVPLDAPMRLRFPDGRELGAARFGVLQFDGSPAPTGLLPDGPTRDFNLMLRDGARGEVLARTLVDSMVLASGPGIRWLAYLSAGGAVVQAAGETGPTLDPGDAALVIPGDRAPGALVRGSGEILLVKLYA